MDYYQNMSVEQIEDTWLRLSSEERRRFARWFYENESVILELPPEEEISPEWQMEIMRRREEALAHPELLEPWGDTTEKLRAQLNEIRRQKIPAR